MAPTTAWTKNLILVDGRSVYPHAYALSIIMEWLEYVRTIVQFQVDSCIQGHHSKKVQFWTPIATTGEQLSCKREIGNSYMIRIDTLWYWLLWSCLTLNNATCVGMPFKMNIATATCWLFIDKKFKRQLSSWWAADKLNDYSFIAEYYLFYETQTYYRRRNHGGSGGWCPPMFSDL